MIMECNKLFEVRDSNGIIHGHIMQHPLKYLVLCLHFLSSVSSEIDGALYICKLAPSEVYLSNFFRAFPF